jgi:hypothetical protein
MYTMQRFLVVMIGAALASAAGAQSLPYQGPPGDTSNAPANAGQTQVDPPARVARLGYLSGNVSFTPAGENDWVQAQVNRPVVTGDKLWTDAGGRAELQIGAATVRLNENSSFDFLNLDDQLAQMEVTQGALDLNVGRLRGNETYEVDTPTIAFVASRVGDYRIDVDPTGHTVVTARRGGGEAIGEGGKRMRIEEGQSVRFNDSQLNDTQVNQIGAPDAFDSFSTERVQRYSQAAPNQYVSQDVVGYQDLNENGTWDDAPEYGHVWYPNNVAADWAPYHDGNWAWVDPWGWTWVDNSPWGYAPFHYGRWAYVGSRWGWVPGPVDVAPVYAPALVAFVGGGGFSVGVSIGGPIGWFALGPRDVYFPGYHCGADYFGRVNYGNSVYINRTTVNNYYGNWSSGRLNYAQINYTNRTAPGALVAMSGSAFVAGRSVRSSAVAVNGTTFANAHVLPRAALAPTRESLVAGRGRASAPPTTALSRPVIAANRPAAAKPSFAQRQSLLQKSAGEPLTAAQMRTLAAHPDNARAAAAANNNVRVVGNRGPEVAARSTTARSDRATEVANAHANGTSPSRAPEMNRAPAKANAQYLRSAGFAHQGVVPGSERATTAEAARANAQSRTSAQTNSRAVQGSANRNTQQFSSTNRAGGNGSNDAGRTQGHLNSSSYAHMQNGRGATNNARDSEVQRRTVTAESTARSGAGSNSMQERGAVRATQSNSARPVTQHSTPPNESHGRSNGFAPQTARTDANARSSAQEYSRSSSSTSNTTRNYRAPEQQRSSTSTSSSVVQHAAPQQSRAPAHVESARENRPAFSQRSAPVQHTEPVQRSAPVQHSEPAQVAHSAPQPQRSQSQPRQVAKQAPQKEPRANDKKNEKDGGG